MRYQHVCRLERDALAQPHRQRSEAQSVARGPRPRQEASREVPGPPQPSPPPRVPVTMLISRLWAPFHGAIAEALVLQGTLSCWETFCVEPVR